MSNRAPDTDHSDRCLASEITRNWTRVEINWLGAGDGIRTRDQELGKLLLYQLSYARTADGRRIVTHDAVNTQRSARVPEVASATSTPGRTIRWPVDVAPGPALPGPNAVVRIQHAAVVFAVQNVSRKTQNRVDVALNAGPASLEPPRIDGAVRVFLVVAGVVHVAAIAED